MSAAVLDRIAIVGNGIAALTAGDALRAAGFDGDLTIIGAERHAPYSRPALSKAALLDELEMTSHLLPAPEHGAEQLLGSAAVGLDVERRRVRLADGGDIPYDGLVIASGSRARRLAEARPGEASVELTLRGLDDALELRRRIAATPDVVVIGGGALGMEVASGCIAAGCRVTLVTRRRPMSSQVGAYLAGMLVAAARDAGVVVRETTDVVVRDAEGSAVVALGDGSSIEAGLVVTAVGDVPNIAWLSDSGLLADGELRVDRRGRVRGDIVAAGDVTAFPTSSGLRRVPLWTSAIEQAKTAAVALLRGDDAAELDFQPYFWTEQFGLNLKACGELPVDGPPEIVEGDPADRRALLRWEHADATATAVALNYRIPVPRLRRLTRPQPQTPTAP